MAAKCKKCDPHEICEECPEWIFTLADLIMCMMGLFVVLWVLKPSPSPPALGSVVGDINKQEARQTEVIDAIRKEFGWKPDADTGEPVPDATEKKVVRNEGENGKGTQTTPPEAAEGTDPQVQSIREGRQNVVGTRVTFERGEITLSADDERILNQTATKIVGSRFIVIIKGHAARDDFGENATQPQFMDVSLRRAQAVSDYLVKRGVSADVMRVQGCSTFEPARQRAYTSDGQKDNRRVEVFNTDTVVRDMQDPHETAAKPLDD